MSILNIEENYFSKYLYKIQQRKSRDDRKKADF